MEKSVEYIYTVTFIFSRYKEFLDTPCLSTFVYFNYEEAKEDMLRTCKMYYKESDIIQEQDSKFFDVFQEDDCDCVMYGENEDDQTGYRVEWGLAKMEKHERVINKN